MNEHTRITLLHHSPDSPALNAEGQDLIRNTAERAQHLLHDAGINADLGITEMGWQLTASAGDGYYLIIGEGALDDFWGATLFDEDDEPLANYSSDLPSLCASGDLLAAFAQRARDAAREGIHAEAVLQARLARNARISRERIGYLH